MSNFFHPMTQQVSRKVHQCECCYYAIEKGALYCRQNGIWEGEYFSSPYHPECWDALDAGGNFEFTPGDGDPPEGARPFRAALKGEQPVEPSGSERGKAK